MTRCRTWAAAIAVFAISATSAGCGDADGSDLVASEVVAAVGEDVEVPPRDADLAPAGWHETAAWIAREAEQGRPVVVNMFASWCEPCRDEAPVFRKVAQDRTDIAFLGVDHEDRIPLGRAFVEDERLGFPTVFDVGGEVARAVGSTGMPTTAFFDADGRLQEIHVGPLTEDELTERIARLEPAAAPGR